MAEVENLARELGWEDSWMEPQISPTRQVQDAMTTMLNSQRDAMREEMANLLRGQAVLTNSARSSGTQMAEAATPKATTNPPPAPATAPVTGPILAAAEGVLEAVTPKAKAAEGVLEAVTPKAKANPRPAPATAPVTTPIPAAAAAIVEAADHGNDGDAVHGNDGDVGHGNDGDATDDGADGGVSGAPSSAEDVE